MSIHCIEERNALPGKICNYCNCADYEYCGLDRENEIATTGIRCCEYEDECKLASIDWRKFILDTLGEKE